MFVKAEIQDLAVVKYIVIETIKRIYPNYYPSEVVDFFLNHHNDERILTDIKSGKVFLFSEKGKYIATGTLSEDHINRVFVLPDFQGKGFGSQIMAFLEKKVNETYDVIYLDSSLPAFKLYTKRGYFPLEYCEENVENNKVLCYHIMKKEIPKVFWERLI